MSAFARVGIAGQALLCATVGCVVFMGCKAPSREPSPGDYAFFGNYPELRQLPAPSGVFLYTNPDKPLRDQDRFIVESPDIVFQPGSDHWIGPSEARELADFLQQEVITSLSERYNVVENAAPGVLRVSLIVADIPLRASSGSSPEEAKRQPFLAVSITDPTTDEAIVLLRDLNRGNEFAAVARSDQAAARRLLSDWAKSLRVRLQEAQRGAAPQPVSQP